MEKIVANDPETRSKDGRLSPRVRGNLKDLLSRFKGAGSIPARAGEPSRQ